MRHRQDADHRFDLTNISRTASVDALLRLHIIGADDILLQFLIESSTVAVIDGAVGVFCGVLVAKLVSWVSPLPSAVQLWSVIGGLLVALSVGLFFGTYPASKAAVNMLTVQYAKAFPNMRINAVEPGFTKTDLNGNTGRQTVEQGAEIIVRMAQVGPDGPTGGYFDAEGTLPW